MYRVWWGLIVCLHLCGAVDCVCPPMCVCVLGGYLFVPTCVWSEVIVFVHLCVVAANCVHICMVAVDVLFTFM